MKESKHSIEKNMTKCAVVQVSYEILTLPERFFECKIIFAIGVQYLSTDHAAGSTLVGTPLELNILDLSLSAQALEHRTPTSPMECEER